MSVILFHKNSVYQKIADAFEDLKHLFEHRSWGDDRFYRALRRLYFANVATYLCQYHDDSPLTQEELAAIDPFIELQGKRTPDRTPVQSMNAFLSAWGSLKYNLTTNDGEMYQAIESCQFMEDIALHLSREVLLGAIYACFLFEFLNYRELNRGGNLDYRHSREISV